MEPDCPIQEFSLKRGNFMIASNNLQCHNYSRTQFPSLGYSSRFCEFLTLLIPVEWYDGWWAMNGKELEVNIRNLTEGVSLKASRSRFEKSTSGIQVWRVSTTQICSMYRSSPSASSDFHEDLTDYRKSFGEFENTFHVSVCLALRIALCLPL